MFKATECIKARKINFDELFAKACKTTRLLSREAERLQNSLFAKIIITTTYHSGCRNPDLVALAHLSTLVAAVWTTEVFAPQREESICKRIESLNHFPEGEPDAVEAGM